MAIKDCVREDGAAAATWVERLSTFQRAEGEFSLLRAVPHTGRKHQIRIHLQHMGHPIVGDKLYGLDESLYLAFVQRRLTEEQQQQLIVAWQALHAEELQFQWCGRSRTFHACPEPWFEAFLACH